MLVVAELAKEKLARICDQEIKWLRRYATQEPSPIIGALEVIAHLIRNTDLTDCQPQKADGEIRPNSDLGNDPSIDSSGTSHLSVEEWLVERLDNCKCIAAGLVGVERDGWIEDASYFGATLGRLRTLEFLLQKLEAEQGGRDRALASWHKEKDRADAATAAMETAKSLLRQIVLLDNDAHPGVSSWHDLRVRTHKAAEAFLGIPPAPALGTDSALSAKEIKPDGKSDE